jgi:hypothetical protein
MADDEKLGVLRWQEAGRHKRQLVDRIKQFGTRRLPGTRRHCVYRPESYLFDFDHYVWSGRA